MWRLGRKKIPDGLVWGGGSDWICLTRDFSRYVLTSKDEMMIGLKQYFTYSLLPAEVKPSIAILNPYTVTFFSVKMQILWFVKFF